MEQGGWYVKLVETCSEGGDKSVKIQGTATSIFREPVAEICQHRSFETKGKLQNTDKQDVKEKLFKNVLKYIKTGISVL